MQRDTREIHKITVEVAIEIAEKYMTTDVALLNLRKSEGHRSKYTEKEFIKEINNGNVVVAILREDPIGYAIIKEGKVEESYVDWEFRDSDLESILKNTKIQKNIVTKTVVNVD